MRYILIVTLLFVAGCSQPAPKTRPPYEDLKGFFDAEAQRLTRANPGVFKTVARNDASETRSVKDIDWETELSLFAESDINKPAWLDSYKVTSGAGKTIYQASDSTLKTREISIGKDPQGKIRTVEILNRTQNMLYSSTEQLLYVRDSLYQIRKHQHVAVMGDNRYFINGILDPR